MKKHDEALMQLKLLIQFANFRFEVHECLVHAFIGVSRWREAQLQAIEACRILGKSPRIYVVNVCIIKLHFKFSNILLIFQSWVHKHIWLEIHHWLVVKQSHFWKKL